MCANIKVRQRRSLFAFIFSIVEKSFTGEKKSFLWNFERLNPNLKQKRYNSILKQFGKISVINPAIKIVKQLPRTSVRGLWIRHNNKGL
jgi:hypothetical protein